MDRARGGTPGMEQSHATLCKTTALPLGPLRACLDHKGWPRATAGAGSGTRLVPWGVGITRRTVQGPPNPRLSQAMQEKKSLHIARTGASRGFSPAAAPVSDFSRGTMGSSGSLLCGNREVRSPWAGQGGARHCSPVRVGESGLMTG